MSDKDRPKASVIRAVREHLASYLVGPAKSPAGVVDLRDPAALDGYRTAFMEVAHSVKIVVWDLDDVLWQGTLAEGSMRPLPQRNALVVALADMGVVNSVCSHNDYDTAKRALVDLGLWDYFVFPRIGLESKALMVRDLLSKAQLRAVNAVFVDDNPRLREEVEFVNDGIWVVPPEIIEPLDASLLPKSDPGRTRLKQYQTLDSRDRARRVSPLSPEEFLRTSRIRVRMVDDVRGNGGRVVELVNRAHQLNFTNSTLTHSELEVLLADPSRENRCIHVWDRFGDYGVCGFMSYDRATHALTHFVLSCRIMGMGVEQSLYERYNRPAISGGEDPAFRLESRAPVDWIQYGDETTAGPVSATATETAPASRRILLKGGCDVETVSDFLQSSHSCEWSVDREGNRKTRHGALVLWHQHTDALILSADVRSRGTAPPSLAGVPWFDEDTWRTSFVTAGHRAKVLSVLQDYGCGTYRHRDEGFVIPGEYFGVDLTDPRIDDTLASKGCRRASSLGITPAFLSWFRERFDYLGPIDTERFVSNLRSLRRDMAEEEILILINGAEVEPEEYMWPFDHAQVERHRVMNGVLDDVLTSLPRTYLVDVRRWVTSPDDVTDRLFHYRRAINVKIAGRVVEILAAAQS